jgi:Co/Zn/Cd efflux system component
MAMADHCCSPSTPSRDARYGRIIIAALVINAGMFAVEVAAGLAAGSVALQADALDFLSDAGNYAISLMVLGMTLKWRARAALLKGWSLGVLGLLVFAATLGNVIDGTVPEVRIMGLIGALALVANVGVAALLFAYRTGDSNMRSVWLCSRNDAIANIGVLLAALGVFGTATGWPDVIVATVIAGLAVSAAIQIIRQARAELRHTAHAAAE